MKFYKPVENVLEEAEWVVLGEGFRPCLVISGKSTLRTLDQWLPSPGLHHDSRLRFHLVEERAGNDGTIYLAASS